METCSPRGLGRCPAAAAAPHCSKPFEKGLPQGFPKLSPLAAVGLGRKGYPFLCSESVFRVLQSSTQLLLILGSKLPAIPQLELDFRPAPCQVLHCQNDKKPPNYIYEKRQKGYKKNCEILKIRQNSTFFDKNMRCTSLTKCNEKQFRCNETGLTAPILVAAEGSGDGAVRPRLLTTATLKPVERLQV